MRTFVMNRASDETGVSGTGDVLEGVQFSDGRVAVRWLSDLSSIAVYDSIRDFVSIHISSHPTNNTTLTFSDGTVWRGEPAWGL